MREILVSPTFYIWISAGTKKLSNLSKVTSQVKSRIGISTYESGSTARVLHHQTTPGHSLDYMVLYSSLKLWVMGSFVEANVVRLA